jgi:anion-transporting  ArsA/GET3 family ATPase
VTFDAWLSTRALIACVGSGGVGKTTTAAALGLRAARLGRRVIVLTIDPAKRLANSLGLEAMGGEPTRIDLGSLDVAEGGELWAMMLDARGTFDALIGAVSPTPEARDRILRNHVYRHMADALAGSQDYMATEKLYDLVQSGRWDLVVLDTPPVKNALDFLEAPGKVARFLDERVLGWFLAPYERKSVWASRVLAGTSAFVFRLLGLLFGREFLDDFAQFLADFNGLYEGFRARHLAVDALMRAEATSFLCVSAPTEASADVAEFFLRELAARSLPRAGVIINQVHLSVPATADDREALADALGPDGASLARWAASAHAQLAELAAAEAHLVKELRDAAAGLPFARIVPRLAGEVHDLAALARVGDLIAKAPAEA